MGDRRLTVLWMIAVFGLIGGVLLAALGVVTLVQASGFSVFGWLTALSVATGELLLAAVVTVLAALLLRAVSILGAPGSGRAPASLRRRVITGVAAAAVLSSWIAPAALTFSAGSSARLDVTFSMLGLGIGVVAAATAFAARDLLVRPLGIAMLLLSLLSVVLPLSVSSNIAESQGRQEAYAAGQAHFEERFAEILQGPTIEEVAAGVGDLGGWRLLAGGVTPMQRGSTHLDRQDSLTDLGGSVVRFALVGQCTADFDRGQLVGATTVFGLRQANGDPLDSWSLESPVVPCDGSLHMDVSDAVSLPAWDAATLAGAGRDWELVMTYAVVGQAQPVVNQRPESIFGDSGERWLVFVAPEPTPPSEPLLATVGAHLAPLRPR
jgi:hypothetical protein